jgi:hypothetical protein
LGDWGIQVGRYKLGDTSWEIQVERYESGDWRWTIRDGGLEIGVRYEPEDMSWET